MTSIKIFKYIDTIDCFVVNPEYKRISDKLGLTEWNEVVWIGRYFLSDNDFGEHWFDNWDEREKLMEGAKAAGINWENLLIIDPHRFKNDLDGPCHTDIQRKNFWTDVLRSLELSIDVIGNEAEKFNNKRKTKDEDYIPNLRDRINEVKRGIH